MRNANGRPAAPTPRRTPLPGVPGRVTREVVDRKALEVLDPGIYETAWRVGAPVVKLAEVKP